MTAVHKIHLSLDSTHMLTDSTDTRPTVNTNLTSKRPQHCLVFGWLVLLRHQPQYSTSLFIQHPLCLVTTYRTYISRHLHKIIHPQSILPCGGASKATWIFVEEGIQQSPKKISLRLIMLRPIRR